ncbi:MAG: metallophosphoesterase, partial [Treponema sp.]|nr:metallophosphoesterase [Treponema sp.]
MKLAHIADLHCSREHAEEALASLRFFAEHIKKSPVDLVCVAGDVWDASILNTEASGYNRFVDAIREIAENAPVAMIYGTPSHDTDGSLEVFRKIDCKYGITILEPGQAYFLYSGVMNPESEHFISSVSNPAAGDPEAILFGIPEPRKKYLLAGEASGKDETEEAVRDALHRLCFLLAAKRREYPDVPCVVLYHGDVAGSTLQNDQTVERGTGIAITVDDLADIGADYYALGHIHKPQSVGNLPAFYAGSIYPKNFGETHQAGFNVFNIEADVNGFRTKGVIYDFPHPQNLKLEHTFQPFGLFDPAYGLFEPDSEAIKGKRVWLELTCTKERRTIMGDPERYLELLMQMGAAPGSRVTVNELPVETVRAAEIAGVESLPGKFQIWAEQSGKLDYFMEHSLSMTGKIDGLEENIRRESGAGSGEWELVSVRVRGAVGIRK